MILAEGDWAIVQFPLDDQKGFRRFIGQILDISESGYLMDCVRPKITANKSGYIDTFPNVRDNKTRCQSTDIITKLNPPTLWQCSLNFETHCDNL